MLLLAATQGCGTDGVGEPVLPPPTRAGYYVAANGSPEGSGAGDSPWDLATALAGAAGVIEPGDTVWLRHGRYVGTFRTELEGRADAYVTFRQYPGERATLDGSLDARGAYLTFWGFEVMQSAPLTTRDRVLQAYTTGGRFVNLVLHDAGISGVSIARDHGDGLELYGCLVYNNGTNENLDHGIYANNDGLSTKYIEDNIFFNNYARGIQIYDGGGAALRNIHVEGNVSFNNGTISASSTRINLLISAPIPTSGMAAIENFLYASPGSDGINIRLGNYDATHNTDVVLRRNYVGGGIAGLQMRYQWGQAEVEENLFVGGARVVETGGSGLAASYEWHGNEYRRDPAQPAWEHEGLRYDFEGWKAETGLGTNDQAFADAPSSAAVFVRPNRYEAGRAHVIIYNWGRHGVVPVDVSSVLRSGDRYALRNAQDYYGTPVVAGTFDGGTIGVPMTGVEPPTPLGRTPPARAPKTAPEFDVFVLTVVPDASSR